MKGPPQSEFNEDFASALVEKYDCTRADPYEDLLLDVGDNSTDDEDYGVESLSDDDEGDLLITDSDADVEVQPEEDNGGGGRSGGEKFGIAVGVILLIVALVILGWAAFRYF